MKKVEKAKRKEDVPSGDSRRESVEEIEVARELVLPLAITIAGVLFFCALALLVHWFGFLPVLVRLFVVLALVATFKYRATLLRIMRECKEIAILYREERRRVREERHRAVLQARLLTRSGGAPQRNRNIPARVMREVYRRDMGRCMKCGSEENIEYDHIIPFSRGGSNTARNIRILCETCNRKKGARIE